MIDTKVYELGSIISRFCVVFRSDIIAESRKRTLVMRIDAGFAGDNDSIAARY